MRPTLLAVAHGSADPRSTTTLRRLRTRVASLAPHLDVRLALLGHAGEHGMLDVPTALRSLAQEGRRAAVVVPLLLTPAYHARVDLPLLLEASRTEHPHLRAVQAPGLGPHPLLGEAALRRLRESGAPRPDGATALVLAAAGSSDTTAVASVHRLAATWARAGWWDVKAGFASAARPTVGEAVRGLRRQGAPRVVAVSYVLSWGRLPDRAREQALDAGAAQVTEPVGDTPELAELVLARYAEALPGTHAATRRPHRRPELVGSCPPLL